MLVARYFGYDVAISAAVAFDFRSYLSIFAPVARHFRLDLASFGPIARHFQFHLGNFTLKLIYISLTF